jgi:hypothetical protein
MTMLLILIEAVVRRWQEWRARRRYDAVHPEFWRF